MILGDLGADIIKIEHPERGDDTRHWGPPFIDRGQSAYFLSANRNKRSLGLNLKHKEGMEILRQLIQQADVLVENFRVGTLERLGIGEDELRELRPDLIYCTLTGYGYTGPYKDQPGYDFIAQALGGFMSINGPVDGEPHRAGLAIADLTAGIFAANAILAALFGRERDGLGHRLDISLLDSMVALMSYVGSNHLVSGEPAKRYGNAHPNIVPYQAFEADDGYFAMAAGNDGQWAALCEAIDHPEWIEDERYATNPQRLHNRDHITELLNDVFKQKSTLEWLKIFEEIGLAAAPINSIEKVFEDPQVVARKLHREVSHPTIGTVPLIASPLNIPTAPTEIRRAPPLLGEHTREILKDLLEYKDNRIEELQNRGAI
jgi:formyl-CoA transferase